MTGRALFHDEDAARAVVNRLLADGFAARLVRARFAGEDDDEDQPWSIVSDAPDSTVELLADAHEGWMDYEELAMPSAGTDTPPPVPLPTEPIRLKRHPGD